MRRIFLRERDGGRPDGPEATFSFVKDLEPSLPKILKNRKHFSVFAYGMTVAVPPAKAGAVFGDGAPWEQPVARGNGADGQGANLEIGDFTGLSP